MNEKQFGLKSKLYKNKKSRNIVFLFILVVGICSIFFSTSYSFFRKTEHLTDISFVTGDLSYTLTSTDLSNGSITVPANSYKYITVKVKANNTIDSKFSLFYNYVTSLSSTEKSNFDVGYSYLSDNSSYGEITSNGEKEVMVQIMNNNSKSVQITFGVQGGLKSNELVLASNNNGIKEQNYLLDYSGNNYHGKLMNGVKFIYDETEKMYALDFDGVDDYVDIADLPASIDWTNGFTIEYSVKWDRMGSANVVLYDFGNNPGNNNFMVYSQTGNQSYYFNANNKSDYIGFGLLKYGQYTNYKTVYTKSSSGYNISLYENNDLVKSKDISFENGPVNVLRTENYISNKHWSGTDAFDGKLYNLKITKSDGEVILWYAPNMQFDFDYTGKEQSLNIPITGKYVLETWGAQGANISYSTYNLTGGLGGYAAGNIELKSNTKIYAYVGENFNGYRETACFNGGGSGSYGTSEHDYNGNGGGATDFRLVGGAWNDFNSLKSRIIVAAGGGGSMYYFEGGNNGGSAGGLIGGEGLLHRPTNSTDAATPSPGGTQVASLTNKSCTPGGFGYGGNSETFVFNYFYKSGGGGGYYGGTSGGAVAGATVSSGGGGSSYVSGHFGCDAISSTSTASNIVHTEQSVHYSGLKFTNTKIIDGAGYAWRNIKERKVGMILPHGNLVDGNSGNGYARITYLKNNQYILNNIITDGSFKKPLSGWYNGSNYSLENESMKVIISNTQYFLRKNFTPTNNTAGHVLYASIKTKRENSTLYPGFYIISGETSSDWPTNNQTSNWATSSSPVDQWFKLSKEFTANYNYTILMLAQSSGSASGSMYFDDLVLVDLTEAFGAGNEPSTEWCDQNIEWFEGQTIVTK